MSTPISAAQRQEAQRLLTTSERHLQSAGNVHNLDSQPEARQP